MRDTQRIDKILSNFGFGTRREIKQLIKDGKVKVDDSIVKDSGLHVAPENSTIDVEGEILRYRKFIHVMMNKPQGVVSATFDKSLKTVKDILPEEFKCFDLFPAGRLDIDTEGLLLMTNDGQLAHEILSPKKHVSKRYYALVEGNVSYEDVKAFADGIVFDDGYRTLPSELNILKGGNISEVEIVIYEGKFHQIKRMFEASGKKVKYLNRTQMGRLKLDKRLALGECRELLEEEVEALRQNEEAES